MHHQGARTKVLDRLLASLAEADQGSRELDIIMSFVLGETSGEAGKLVELLVDEGYPWDIVSELLDHDLPPYTTSLDAALPGEDIVLSIYSARRRLWGAAHRIADGRHVMRWAATECLARRLAVLSALAQKDAAKPAGAADAAAAAQSGEPAPPPQTDEPDWPPSAGGSDEGTQEEGSEEAAGNDEDESEWKILF